MLRYQAAAAWLKWRQMEPPLLVNYPAARHRKVTHTRLTLPFTFCWQLRSNISKREKHLHFSWSQVTSIIWPYSTENRRLIVQYVLINTGQSILLTLPLFFQTFWGKDLQLCCKVENSGLFQLHSCHFCFILLIFPCKLIYFSTAKNNWHWNRNS